MVAAVAVASLGVLASWAAAQRPAPILHEYLPPLAGSVGRSDHVVASKTGGTEALPEAIETALGRIARPKAEPAGGAVPLYQARPPAFAGPDRRTGGDLDLHYQMVFDPEVAPFKRESSLDRVGVDLRMSASGTGNVQQVVGQPARPGHELFWGHVQLKLQPNQAVVLPSVAPTSQVLSWQVEPPVALQLWRDRAGNFSVQADHTGVVDLRFLMDGPTDYFAAPLGVATARDDPENPVLSPEVAAMATALWPTLGVHAQLERGAAIGRLVEWFRSFEPGEPPPATGAALSDLVLSKKGVCRHRALGFVIMVQSLGISAHFVSNDAHAFAEVWAPAVSGRGAWQRVDLGGGADSLELHGAQGKHLHQPLHADPFPKPDAYANATGRVVVDGAPLGQTWAGAGQVKGASGLQGAQSPSAAVGAASAGAGQSNAGHPKAGHQQPQSEQEARRTWLQQRAQALAAPVQPPGIQPTADKPAQVAKARCRLRLSAVAAMAWLGDPLALAGHLDCDGPAAGSLAIELWLIDPAMPSQAMLLGVVATAAHGAFAATFSLPADAAPHVYDIVARFGGDHLRAPADSGP